MVELRPYQRQTVSICREKLGNNQNVCLVSPTGSGKMIMLAESVRGFQTLWVNNRRDLLDQTRARLAHHPNIHVHSVLSKNMPENVERVVGDEIHHGPAATWGRVYERYRVPWLGGTATPERADSAPLGDMFDQLVVAASYSELLRDGFLSPCRVFGPTRDFDRGLAQSPLASYKRYAYGKCGFCFVSSIAQGERVCAEFVADGIAAELITGKMSKNVRKGILERFETGETTILVNVGVLVEGYDSAKAEVCLLARKCIHVGTFLQIVGRVLRPFPGKQHAILIDLVGAYKRHGLPTMDREYSLEGKAIRKAHDVPSVRQCFKCGACMLSSERSCITCGVKFIPGVHAPPKILNVQLAEVYAGSETPLDAKQAELIRLLNKGERLTQASKKFERLFGHRPDWSRVPNEILAREVRTMLQHGIERARAYAIVKSITNRYPR